jgi:hypothetical protein
MRAKRGHRSRGLELHLAEMRLLSDAPPEPKLLRLVSSNADPLRQKRAAARS